MFQSRLRDRLIAPVVLTTVAAAFLRLSWRKWADFQIDFGKEIYIPWQLAEGRSLYHDIPDYNGPMSYSFNSWLFRLFGPHMMTLAWANLVLVVLLTWLIHSIFLRLADRSTALAVSVIFLLLFAFAQYTPGGNYNFVCPYGHHVTHGVILSMGALLLMIEYMRGPRSWHSPAIGFLTGLVALTKAEVFVALAAAVVTAAAPCLPRQRQAGRSAGGEGVRFLVAFCLPIGCFALLLARAMPLGEAIRGMTDPYLNLFNTALTSNAYFASGQGMDQPWVNAGKMAAMFGAHLALLAVICALSRVASIGSGNLLRLAVIGTLLLGLLVFLHPLMGAIPWFETMRPLPLWMLLLSVVFARAARRGDPRARLLLLFSVFSFVLLGKILLNARIYHYGFAHAMPATLLLASVLLAPWRGWIRLGIDPRCFRAVAAVFVGFFVFVHVGQSVSWYAAKGVPIGNGPDMMLAEPSRRAYCTIAAIEEIPRLMGPEETFAGLPEGAMLNVLTHRRNPSAFVNFMATEFAIYGEDRIVESLRTSAPDYVVLVDKNMSEFGYGPFGERFGGGVMAWVRANYAPVWSVGAPPLTGRGFGISILRRTPR